jgi:hypothetical protein
MDGWLVAPEQLTNSEALAVTWFGSSVVISGSSCIGELEIIRTFEAVGITWVTCVVVRENG